MEQERDYEKERKRKMKEAADIKKGDRKALGALVALVAAIIVFVVLTIIQKNIVNQVEQVSVVVAIKDVPKGIVLTEDTIKSYFDVELRNTADVPNGCYSSGYPLIGMITGRDILKKEIVTPTCIVSENIYEGIEDPVEIAIEVGKIGQAVGGSLRAGDIIDIMQIVDMSYSLEDDSSMESEISSGGSSGFYDREVPEIEYTNASDMLTNSDTGETESDVTVITPGNTEEMEAEEVLELFTSITDILIGNSASYVWSATGRYASVPVCENVRVINAYTSAGVDTASAVESGEEPVASIITIVVPRAMQDKIALAMEEGTLRISRIIDTSKPATETEGESAEEKTDADTTEDVSADKGGEVEVSEENK